MYGLYIIFLSWATGVAEPVQFQTVAIYKSYEACRMARDGYDYSKHAVMRAGISEENVPHYFACIYGPYGSDLFK